jgi:hypothetical protein
MQGRLCRVLSTEILLCAQVLFDENRRRLAVFVKVEFVQQDNIRRNLLNDLGHHLRLRILTATQSLQEFSAVLRRQSDIKRGDSNCAWGARGDFGGGNSIGNA